MADYVFNRDTTIRINATVKDEYGNVVPVWTPERFTVQIKTPQNNTTVYPYTTGVTGPAYSYNGQSGPSIFYFTYNATLEGDYKYKIQYNAFASGSYQLIGPLFKVATVGTFRVVDDAF